MTLNFQPASPSLSELPADELIAFGRSLGLALDERTAMGELLRRVRERQELLGQLDRDAMLDIVVWARRPVRRSAGKEELARDIAQIHPARFDGLSHRGLVTLARLRGLTSAGDLTRPEIEERLRGMEGFWQRLGRKRRALVGTLLTRLIHEEPDRPEGEYRFLPDEVGPSLRTHIEEEGVVGGIARKLRGVADDYVKEKLDEIETRIDRKLDEIDRRMAEWRDREVSNRLRIVKITLIASVLVAAIGIGYDYLKGRMDTPPQSTATDVREAQ